MTRILEADDRNDSAAPRETHLPAHLAPWATLCAVAGAAHGVDPLLLLAVIDRESRGGLALSPPGPGGTGDNGHGRGLMQVDDRAWGNWLQSHDWRNPAVNIDKGARILASAMAEFPKSLSSAIAAYNCGAGNVRKAILAGHDCDYFTTGGDYSRDVLRRRAALAQEAA